MLPVYKACSGYEEFCEQVNVTDIEGGLDDEVELDDDEAYTTARDACDTITGEHEYKDSMFSILDYLELIAQHATGFSYEKNILMTTTTRRKRVAGNCVDDRNYAPKL